MSFDFAERFEFFSLIDDDNDDDDEDEDVEDKKDDDDDSFTFGDVKFVVDAHFLEEALK